MGKIQVVKLNQELCTKSNVDDNEVLFIRVSDLVEDKNSDIRIVRTYANSWVDISEEIIGNDKIDLTD